MYLPGSTAPPDAVAAANTKSSALTAAPTAAKQERENQRLAKMQARFAELSAEGRDAKGLQARASFDATTTDPLLARAQEARVDGDDARADQLLAEAEKLEPGDPRVALARAELASERGDFPAARAQLERALALDPNVPLVQYQLGTVCARLGDRSRAAFYLEQSVANFKPNTGARRRAEFELARLEFPILEASGLATPQGNATSKTFRRGEAVIWWGEVSERFYPMNPVFRVRWRGPTGESVFQESLHMSPGGHVASQLRTALSAAGTWHVEVSVEDSVIETLEFELSAGT
jgi:tetratricopeptide (TPR) repeat protein